MNPLLRRLLLASCFVLGLGVAHARQPASAAACSTFYGSVAESLRKAASDEGLAPSRWPVPVPVPASEWPKPEFAAYSLVPLGEIWLSPFACALPRDEARILWAHELGHAIAHALSPELAEDAFPGLPPDPAREQVLASSAAGRIPYQEHERSADVLAARLLFRLSPAAALGAVETFAASCARQAAKAAKAAPVDGSSARAAAFAPLPAEACNKAKTWSDAIAAARAAAEARFLAEEAADEERSAALRAVLGADSRRR